MTLRQITIVCWENAARQTPSSCQTQTLLTGGATPPEVLGWIIDTEALTITLPSRKRNKLRGLLAEWPPSRASAPAKQVSQLAGFQAYLVCRSSGGALREPFAAPRGHAAHCRGG